MILKAFLVVFGCVFLGEMFVFFTKLPLPPSIVGLLILFLALQTGVVRLATVQKLSKTLLDYLVLLVIPACISMMQHLEMIYNDFWVLFVATTLSTFLVLVSTSKSYEWLRAKQKAWHKRTNHDTH